MSEIDEPINEEVAKQLWADIEALCHCPHTYFDGRSAVTQVKWSDKGFVGRCNLCGDVIEK